LNKKKVTVVVRMVVASMVVSVVVASVIMVVVVVSVVVRSSVGILVGKLNGPAVRAVLGRVLLPNDRLSLAWVRRGTSGAVRRSDRSPPVKKRS
jgi:hypothetical protein